MVHFSWKCIRKGLLPLPSSKKQLWFDWVVTWGEGEGPPVWLKNFIHFSRTFRPSYYHINTLYCSFNAINCTFPAIHFKFFALTLHIHRTALHYSITAQICIRYSFLKKKVHNHGSGWKGLTTAAVIGCLLQQGALRECTPLHDY